MRVAGLFSSRFELLGVVVVSVLAAGCGTSLTAPSHYAPFTQTDLQVGTGAEAIAGSTATVRYTLWLYNPAEPDSKGAQLDSTAGRDPFSFTLGLGQVIEGWDRAVAGMRVGGRRRVVIPPSLGYGARRTDVVPPNATLLFEIELLDVQAG